MPATWYMHARICMRYVDQAGRDKATKLPSGGAQSHRLACIWVSSYACAYVARAWAANAASRMHTHGYSVMAMHYMPL